MNMENTIKDCVKRFCDDPKKYDPERKDKPIKVRKSELDMALQLGLHTVMFNKDAFMERLTNIPNVTEGTKLNDVKPLCQAIHAATGGELVEFYMDSFTPTTEVDKRYMDLLRNPELPDTCKLEHLKPLCKFLHDTNRGGRLDAFNGRKRKAAAANPSTEGEGEEDDLPKTEPLSPEDRENWIHLRELLNWWMNEEQIIIEITEKSKWTPLDIKVVYFWTWLGLNVATPRTLRSDVVNIKHRNAEDKEIMLDLNRGIIRIGETLKTGRKNVIKLCNYNIDVCNLKQVLQKLVDRAEALDSDYIFPPLRGQGDKGKYTVSNFNRTCVGDMSEKIFRRRLTVNFLRKAVATADWQRWSRNGSKDVTELFKMAKRLDHSLAVHLIHYVHTEMEDPDFESQFGGSPFESIIRET